MVKLILTLMFSCPHPGFFLRTTLFSESLAVVRTGLFIEFSPQAKVKAGIESDACRMQNCLLISPQIISLLFVVNRKGQKESLGWERKWLPFSLCYYIIAAVLVVCAYTLHSSPSLPVVSPSSVSVNLHQLQCENIKLKISETNNS